MVSYLIGLCTGLLVGLASTITAIIITRRTRYDNS